MSETEKAKEISNASQQRSMTIANQEAGVWDGSSYYEEAEKWLWLFWHKDKPFLPLFQELDITNLLELACGHGRHSEYLINNFGENVKSLVMMDILQSNVDFCANRMGVSSHVTIIKNDGAGFRPAPDESLTAIFCYDAMVHFNREVVKSYLVDARRVLVPGGRALFHHSNFSLDPDTHFGMNPHARAFMSSKLFSKYATDAGLRVVESLVIPWGDDIDLDCLSLIQKE